MSGYIIEIHGRHDVQNKVEILRGGKVTGEFGCATKTAGHGTVTYLTMGQPLALFPTWHLANEVGTVALWPGQQVKVSAATPETAAVGKPVDVAAGDVLKSPARAGSTITIMDPDDLPTMMPAFKPK